MNIQLIHNPRCSKSREALSLLQAAGHTVEVIDYLKAPLALAELSDLQQKLGLPARELLRSGEDEYAALGLARPELSDAELLAAIAAHPNLLQRPIVIKGERAMIARPPELLNRFLLESESP
ncbi:arsenate reductase (glutaredoxin) [Roseateles oligotrophus]|uniref:Arsenate reductase n=1 Tax=Roseateles oligotrophus TaxID=1769250 RepID=A0ABT2Y8S8_9BURK|nr:arsenate reductase (glutaredoxin) [Roseateles oligotrophus]MCV2366704.1 arsenate reductase (glutaredoxin) [Roseateles oligotrophus]